MAQENDEFLQVFMTHDTVIQEFKRWLTAHGWELQPIPRFGEDDDTYVKTHIIVPENLGRLMAERAERFRQGMAVAVRVEGEKSWNSDRDAIENLGYEVALFHPDCAAAGEKKMFKTVTDVDDDVRAFEVDWSEPVRCDYCDTEITKP